MPTQAEYASRLYAVTGVIFDQLFENKRQVKAIVTAAARAMRVERDKCTREISGRWKEEFAKIKLENDEWQKALDAAFKSELQMVYEREGDMLEGLQR